MNTTIITGILAAAALPMAACTYAGTTPEFGVSATYEASPGVVEADDYTPLYYEGNPVYYENDRPYVIIGDEARFLPSDAPRYGVFVDHYHRHHEGYRRWEQHHRPHYQRRGEWHGHEEHGHGDHGHHEHHDHDHH